MLPLRQLQAALRDAILEALPEVDAAAIELRPCPEDRFGDYQCTALMTLAKSRRANPRALAHDVVARLGSRVPADLARVEVAGPGFLNFRLDPGAIGRTLAGAFRGEHLLFDAAAPARRVVVDFSSPNVAKPMHVGHIRSTVLGNCLAEVLRLLGHRVVTDNHIGDWGTQFGKLLVGWKERLDAVNLQRDPLGEMERLYREINDACERDAQVLELARAELVRLQEGETENRALWERMLAESRQAFDVLYARLGVRFDYTLGESFYNARLKGVVGELLERGIARESEGAVVVFFDDVPELAGHPAIIRKSDGAANYATTDLATLEYRRETWDPDEIVYVTDGRQQLHFKQVFAIFRRWHPDAKVQLAHVWFGSILGEDGRPFRTRSGDTVKLKDLLDEAEERAYAVVSAKSPGLDESTRREIARIVGIGAIKYADLLPNRQSDYVFSWDRMLSLEGNTAPYLQYAYTRIRSIFRKAGEGGEVGAGLAIPADGLRLSAPEELALGRHLLNFGFVLEAVASEFRPNYLCNYLYDLAGRFARFYEQCPVLKAAPEERASRLALCDVTGKVLREGLRVLGIETSESM